MSTSSFIKARYGYWASGYLSSEDRTRCEFRQRSVWNALTRIVGTNLDEPWIEEVHSPRALPGSMGILNYGPNLVWDAGLGTLFDHLSFSMPYAQSPSVMEATLRRVASVRCVVAGHAEQASQQVDRATELLKLFPIDRSYQELVDAESQFEVYLLTEMQERFALAHELAHYLKLVDESAFDMLTQRVDVWVEQARLSKVKPGVLRTISRAQWQKEDRPLREAALDPYAWYLRGSGADPVAEAVWPSLTSEVDRSLALLKDCSPSEREEIMCDLLGALAVALDAHQRERGWTAIAGAACARLALANLQVILSLDAWVSSSGEQPLAGWSATTRQHCLNALLPVALPFILDRKDGAGHLEAGDIHTVMHLVEDRFRSSLGVGISRLDWCESNDDSHHSSDKVLLLATFLPLRAGIDHRVVNRTAGGHKFPLGNVHASSKVSSLYVNDPAFREQIDTALRRHRRGDWGEVVQEDWDKNDNGLFEEFQPPIPSRLRLRGKLWSLYTISGEPVLITTSADRAITEVLLMCEYV